MSLTRTWNDCIAIWPVIVAVTVIVAAPAATAIILSLLPVTATRATYGRSDIAVYVRPVSGLKY